MFLQTAFSDVGAYMVLSESSLDDLNSRLENKLPMVQFRPNLTVKGSTAYEEVIRLENKLPMVQFRPNLTVKGSTAYEEVID